MSERRLLFLATEDWFVRSHFLPLLKRARADGWRVVVAAQMSSAQDALRDTGAELVPLKQRRADNSAAAIAAATAEIHAVFRSVDPFLVHAIALKPSLLATLAQGGAPRARFIVGLTGLGHLGVSKSLRDRALRSIVLRIVSGGLRSARFALAVENSDDFELLTRLTKGAVRHRSAILPGAGIDPSEFAATPDPGGTPVRIGFASRLVRSKGLDVLMAAFHELRALNVPCEVHVAGGVDMANPGALDSGQIATWADVPGAVFHGHVTEMANFWRTVHIACTPTRGGEGLPRSLIEAAACARPSVVTRVAGCREFVEDAVTGYVVPPEDPASLAHALAHLTREAPLRQRMGEAARRRVENRYTEAHVADIASRLWREMSASHSHVRVRSGAD